MDIYLFFYLHVYTLGLLVGSLLRRGRYQPEFRSTITIALGASPKMVEGEAGEYIPPKYFMMAKSHFWVLNDFVICKNLWPKQWATTIFFWWDLKFFLEDLGSQPSCKFGGSLLIAAAENLWRFLWPIRKWTAEPSFFFLKKNIVKNIWIH